MKDFESFVKTYSTRDFIYFFSQKSIEIYKEHIYSLKKFGCSMLFPLESFQYGFFRRSANVMLLAWDIPNMAYLSIINANDYRKNIMTEEMAGIGVNLYRGYENKYSGSEYLKNAGLSDLHKFVMGMSYEQFKYKNPEWIYQNFNRNYHILIGASSINRDKLVDANMITKEIFELTVEETLAVEWVVLWLCYNCPSPLSLPEKVYRKKDERILTKNNIERIIDYYSVTYEQVRKSPLGKQIFYSKPFVITQKKREKLAVSIYLVQMMLADGLYWLIRDYYRNNQKGQVFVNAFGEMFEDYFEELMGEYLKNSFWHKIPENKKKSADYYVEFEKAVFIFELKSGMLEIGAKQQTPNVEQINIFYKRNIEKAYKQLKNSELEYKGDKPVIKIFLLYESMPSNTQMIISSLPELFEKDSNCYVMTIEELEMFLTTYKKDRVKFDNIVSRLITSENGARRYKSVFEVLREYQATENMQFTGEKDYFEKIVHSYIGEHTE